MAGPGIDDAQGMATGGKVEVHRGDHRVVLVKEIDAHQIAHSGGGLVHQTAGLAEEHILRILANPRNLRLAHPAIEEQVVDDGADEHLVGCGGAEAGAREHRGGAVGIKALNLAAQLGKPGSHPPNQGGGGVHFLRLGLQAGQLHLGHGIALGQNPDGSGAIYPYRRQGIQIHRRRQYPAPLMVGVVAADLRPSRSRKIPLRLPPKGLPEPGIQCLLLPR